MITEKTIIDSIKHAYSVINIELRKTTVSAVYNILKAFYIDGKQYVLLNAPTGSGKSIIGLMTAISVNYLSQYFEGQDENPGFSYYLTSTKSLQEQMDRDINDFKIEDVNMLKGTDNYDCTFGNDYLRNKKGLTDFNRQTYRTAWCEGLPKEERAGSQYSECAITCPYEVQRWVTSKSKVAILNYHYFLNIKRSDFNPYFVDRELTICDEAHMLPEIVESFCSMDFNINVTRNIKHFCQLYSDGARSDDILLDLITTMPNIENWFKQSLNYDNFIQFIDEYSDFLLDAIEFVSSKINSSNMDLTVSRLLSSIKSAYAVTQNVTTVAKTNIKNVYIESNTTETEYYKHSIKNLKETELIQEHFVKKVGKLLMMSATLGNLNDFADTMGFESDTVAKFNIRSSWSYDNSPIYLTESGYLNYSNFKKNIDKVIDHCLYICEYYHPKEKGIIHTATFDINNRIKNLLGELPPDYNNFKRRFLFYENSDEKEKNIEKLKSEDYPYILIGPSLSEGIDLDDDNGRFNILIKVPYPQINSMTKRKMDISPLWYKRVTIEKVIQSIGRTNRNKDDFSTVYLLDKGFARLVWDMDEEHITKRLEYIRI